jgi:hypothetical protein
MIGLLPFGVKHMVSNVEAPRYKTRTDKISFLRYEKLKTKEWGMNHEGVAPCLWQKVLPLLGACQSI